MKYKYPEKVIKFINKNNQKFVVKGFNELNNAQDILKKSKLPFLRIDNFHMNVNEMFKEAQALEKVMIPHRSNREEHRGWKSIVIHGISSVHTLGAERYGMDPEDNSIYSWTDVSKLTPHITAFFKNSFKYDWYQRIRIMMLEPGGYITPHHDFDHYVLGPVNIALNNPEGCSFYMENCGVVPFEKGTINKLALVNEHCVVNDSDETRFHIIVHGCPNWRHWSEIYKSSYKKLVNCD